MKEFCPKCGSEKGPFIEGFCSKCFLEDHELLVLPDVLEIEMCAMCNKLKLSGQWHEYNDRTLVEFIAKKIKLKEITNPELNVELTESKHNELKAKIKIKGEISGDPAETEKNMAIRWKRVCCPFCGKLSSGFFEVKIQLRWDSERDEKKEKQIYFELKHALKELKEKDPLAVITNQEMRKEGQDIFIASGKAARTAILKIKKKFGFKYLHTKKLVGLNQSGKNRYQFTYSIRL